MKRGLISKKLKENGFKNVLDWGEITRWQYELNVNL